MGPQSRSPSLIPQHTTLFHFEKDLILPFYMQISPKHKNHPFSLSSFVLAAEITTQTPPSQPIFDHKIITTSSSWIPLKKMVIWIKDLKVFLIFLDVLLKFSWSLPQDYFRAISTALKLYLKSRREGPSLWWCLLVVFNQALNKLLVIFHFL